MSITVQIEGIDKLKSKLARVKSGVDLGSTTAVMAQARLIQSDMQDFAPVDTGALRDSITFETSKGGKVADIGPGDEIDYAIYQEFGTEHQPAQPYATPAAEAARRTFPALVKRDVERQLP